MARNGVTYHQVAKAAAQLAEVGQIPTIDKVRNILGTGSKSTLAPLLKQWKIQQEETISEAETGLPQGLIAIVKGLYEGMQQQAQTLIESAQEENYQKVTTAYQAQRAAEEHQREIEIILAQQQQVNAQLEADYIALKKTWEESQQIQRKLLLQTEVLTQRLKEQSHRVQDLKHHLSQTQKNLEHYQESVRQQRSQERSDFEQQLSYKEYSLKKMREEKQILQAANTQLEKTAIQWQSQWEQQQAENTILTEEIKNLNQQTKQLYQQLSIGEGRYEILAQAHQQATVKLQDREQDLIKQERALAVAQDKLKTLNTMLAEIKDHNAQLQAENQMLIQEKVALEERYKQYQR